MAERFFFAWVEEGEPFGIEHEREDLQIESLDMEHGEGNNAKCSIVIRNPKIGLLAPGRPTWAHISVETDTAVRHIFYGQLDAIPSDLLDERATLLFLARAVDQAAQKQALAEVLKLPPYDPIFIADELRDDPDTVLECRSMLWHFDRVTHVVTVSDVLLGEDGIEEFTEDDVPHDSLQFRPSGTPQRYAHVDMNVKWTQTGTGSLQLLDKTFSTYTGDGIIGDWPEVGADIGAGYTAIEGTRAYDLNGVDVGDTISGEYHFKNQRKEIIQGSSLSIDISFSGPLCPTFVHTNSFTSQAGYFDPYSDPQINRPAKVNASYTHIGDWNVHGILNAGYEVALQRTERLKFTLEADLQQITTSSGEGDSEIIALNGVDIGKPMLNILNWSSVAGRAVALGQLIKSRLEDGTIVYLIATQSGTAGTEEPEFSDVIGDTTVDGPTSGPVIWTSLGTQLFPDDVPGWAASDTIPLGELILPEGTSSYQLCTDPGLSGLVQPNFAAAAGVTTVDNGVVWTSLGPFGAFLGPPIEDTTRGVFFPTDRGLRAVEYGLSVARARLYFKARAISITFACRFERALELSCRKNARLYSERLPGGVALGKIVSYSIKSDGPAGRLIGSVTMGCAIGHGGTVVVSPGEPTYAEVDTLLPEVQVFTGTIYGLASDDIVYSRPIDEPSDDDLHFPLTREQVVVREELHGDKDAQLQALLAALPPTETSDPEPGNVDDGYQISSKTQRTFNAKAEATRKAAQEALERAQIWYELELRPLVAGPFNSRYDIDVSVMNVPKMIDLEAEST